MKLSITSVKEFGTMELPGFQEYTLPLLRLVQDGQEHRIRDLIPKIADQVGLTPAQREAMLPSGQQTILSNRMGWAKTYMKKAGLLSNATRGNVRITDLGRRALADSPQRIDITYLRQFEPFEEFLRATAAVPVSATEPAGTVTPEENIETAYGRLREALVDDILDRLKASSPQFFERTVVKLLVAMGYGGSLTDAGQAIGRSGDGGIDGIIKEDKLGLDVVCIQAKRWEQTVGRPQVQAFAGSMEGMRARKGAMISTSTFSRDAIDYVNRIERKIVLIGGDELERLMIDYNVGATMDREFVIKKVDLDYFEENEA